MTTKERCSFLARCLGGQLPPATPVSWSCGWQGFAGKTKSLTVITRKVKLGFLPFKLLSLSEVCFMKVWLMERLLGWSWDDFNQRGTLDGW